MGSLNGPPSGTSLECTARRWLETV